MRGISETSKIGIEASNAVEKITKLYKKPNKIWITRHAFTFECD